MVTVLECPDNRQHFAKSDYHKGKFNIMLVLSLVINNFQIYCMIPTVPAKRGCDNRVVSGVCCVLSAYKR